MLDQTEHRRADAVLRARADELDYAVAHETTDPLRFALDQVEAVTDSRLGCFHVVDDDQRGPRLQAWSSRTMHEACRAEGVGAHYPIDKAGIRAECIHRRQAVVYHDYPAVAHRRGLPPEHTQVQRFLSIPIVRGGPARGCHRCR